jgi:hypothetical protein
VPDTIPITLRQRRAAPQKFDTVIRAPAGRAAPQLPNVCSRDPPKRPTPVQKATPDMTVCRRLASAVVGWWCALFSGNHVISLFLFLLVLWKQFPPPRRWCALPADELIDTSREPSYCRRASCRNICTVLLLKYVVSTGTARIAGQTGGMR